MGNLLKLHIAKLMNLLLIPKAYASRHVEIQIQLHSKIYCSISLRTVNFQSAAYRRVQSSLAMRPTKSRVPIKVKISDNLTRSMVCERRSNNDASRDKVGNNKVHLN
jgi:hypothetical protein